MLRHLGQHHQLEFSWVREQLVVGMPLHWDIPPTGVTWAIESILGGVHLCSVI